MLPASVGRRRVPLCTVLLVLLNNPIQTCGPAVVLRALFAFASSMVITTPVLSKLFQLFSCSLVLLFTRRCGG